MSGSNTTISTFDVPLIGDQVAPSNEAAVELLDTSLTYINTALNSLAIRLSDHDTKNAIIQHDVDISEDVEEGSLVYFNSETSTYEPAVAALLPLPGENGASIEAPSARVEGIIVSKDISGVTGTLLRGGYYTSSSVVNYCLGQNATAGTYYLSTTNPGRATKETDGLLRQPVLSYYGNGMFGLTLFYIAHDNHYHTTAMLISSWDTADPEDEDTPDGYLWVYNGELLRTAYVGTISRDTTAVFYNGILQPILTDSSSDFTIVNGKLYCKLTTQPESNSVVIFNHFPFAYNSAVVRGITSTNENMLRVENTNGVVTLTPYDFVSGGMAPSAVAVSSIIEGTVTYTPVVTGTVGGPGIQISRDVNGVATISATSLVGSQIDAYSIQHNGTTLITDGIFQYITFPAGRESEFVMSLPITDVPDDVTLKAYAWGTLNGTSTTLNVTGWYVEQPVIGSNTALPSINSATVNELSFNNGQAGMLSYGEVLLSGVTISAPGMLVARVTIPSIQEDNVELLRVGFRLEVDSTATSALTRGPGGSGVITGEMQAGERIEAGQAVYVNSSGRLGVCRANAQNLAGACVGIATNGSSAGGNVTYVISGITSVGRTGAALIPGTPVYIGTDGFIKNITSDAGVTTFLEGTALYLQRVGTAVTANLLQVAIEPAVIKGAI